MSCLKVESAYARFQKQKHLFMKPDFNKASEKHGKRWRHRASDHRSDQTSRDRLRAQTQARTLGRVFLLCCGSHKSQDSKGL